MVVGLAASAGGEPGKAGEAVRDVGETDCPTRPADELGEGRSAV